MKRVRGLKAEDRSRRQKAEGRRRKAEGGRQKAEGRRQKAEGRRRKAENFNFHFSFSICHLSFITFFGSRPMVTD